MSTTRQEVPLQQLVRRLPIRLMKDDKRVITLPFAPWTGARVKDVLDRVIRMTDEEVEATLVDVRANFGQRHRNLNEIFHDNFQMLVSRSRKKRKRLSENRKMLIGSYFTMEYSLESCALFNPSIVRHPDQAGLTDGDVRFIMSLRATGEGHISSVVFRSGVLDHGHNIHFDPSAKYSSRTRLSPDQKYLKPLFRRKLGEMGVNLTNADAVLEQVPDSFTFTQLEGAIANRRKDGRGLVRFAETVDYMRWLARSNYQLDFGSEVDLSHLIIYPQSDNEARGIEDLRLVEFREDDGSIRYFGTYTAYNGFRILPMLMETSDFKHIAIHTLNGACAQNKGMAVFPRRINGHYAVCSRIDGQNLFIMYSDYIHFWETAELLAEPAYPWELMIIGNCGSPIETPEGWLLLTHGVGPMRRYCIGAMLLDLENPLRVIGRLREPFIVPTEDEREGYVPNVVYSCGSMVHRGELFVPYAMADRATGFAMINLDDIIGRLLASPP